MVRGSELDVAVRASIVSMRFGAGMEAKLIAEKLNLDAGTVRGTCHRIKKAANSEDLLELLKHCRTKSRSGRPSMKGIAAAAAAAAAASSATAEGSDEDATAEPEPEALAATASTTPDRFETTAWPDRDLTAANETTHIQPHPPLAQYQLPPTPDAITVTALDPRLTADITLPDTTLPQQWPPGKT
jgi:hypothetical protein